MNIVVKKLTIDVAKKNKTQKIIAKQYDNKSRFINATITNEGEKLTIGSDKRVLINALREDENSKSFEGSVLEDGTVLVPITYWMLENEGLVECDISIIGSEEESLTTTVFYINVEAASRSNDDISEDENSDILLSLIKSVNNIKAEEVNSATKQWLDEHPDATTTVKNGSIVLEKFHDSTKEWIRGGVANVKDFRAKGDGTTDDTDAIQSAINKASTIYFPSGVYLVTPKGEKNNPILTLHSNMHIILDANARIQRATTNLDEENNRKQPIFVASKCDNIVIEGGKIYGDIQSYDVSTLWAEEDADMEYQNHGIVIRECTNVTIKDCEIANHIGDSVCVGSATTWNDNIKQSKNICIENCILHDSHRHGLVFGGVDNAVVRNTEIYGIKWLDEIDFESNWSDDVPNTNIEIVGCKFHSPDPIKAVRSDGTKVSKNYGVMNNDCPNLIVRDSYLRSISAKKDTNILNCKADRITIYDAVSSVIDGCIIKRLESCSSANIVNVKNCLFKVEDEESQVIIANILAPSSNYVGEPQTLDINYYNCKLITSTKTDSAFVSNAMALRHTFDSCEFILRNGRAIRPSGIDSQILNCSVFLWNDEIGKSTRCIETSSSVENLEIINNVIYASDVIKNYAQAGALINLGSENVQVISNMLLTKSAVGVTNNAPINFLVSVTTACVIGNTLPLYSKAYSITDGGVAIVKSANNVTSSDLTT